MTEDERAATVEAARTRVKRADGLLREALRDLASATDGATALGTTRVHDDSSRAAAIELIGLGVARYGAVDVVVIARTIRRRRHPAQARRRAPAPQEHHAPADPQ